MGTRQQLKKSTRFEVFKRDHFTCQYCGAQPPHVVLVIDHIHPIAAGGDNSADNLVAACEPCNAGKRDKLLSKIPIRPDADLLYLETQQEMAEIKRFRESMQQLEEERAKLVTWLQDVWQDAAGTDWVPADAQVKRLLVRYGYEIAHKAIHLTALKYATTGFKPRSGWVTYMWVVAKNTAEESNG